jgi:hypothetical protein
VVGVPARSVGRLAGCLVSTVLLAACTSGKPTRYVTVTAGPPSKPSGSSNSAATTTGARTPTPSPSAANLTKLDGTCDTLLPDASVFDAVGVTSLPGPHAFVVGRPEADIGRIGYLNCRYGLTGTGAAATPAIEIGVSLYVTGAKAAARIAATVDDYTAHGATGSAVKVAGLPATMLTGGAGDGYTVPLLVVSSGQRTVAVSISDSVATGDKAVTDATALAALALDRTAH